MGISASTQARKRLVIVHGRVVCNVVRGLRLHQRLLHMQLVAAGHVLEISNDTNAGSRQ